MHASNLFWVLSSHSVDVFGMVGLNFACSSVIAWYYSDSVICFTEELATGFLGITAIKLASSICLNAVWHPSGA